MEEKRRANRAFARIKQLGIWAAALVFSYVDLGTTVVVGKEYLDMETAQGAHAAHVTLGMLGASLGLQTFFVYLSGTTAFSYDSNRWNRKYSTHHSTPLSGSLQAKESSQRWPQSLGPSRSGTHSL